MLKISRRVALIIALTSLSLAGGSKAKSKVEISRGVLWRAPNDIASRDLFYGPGGKEHEPRGTMTFEKEDPDGTNPKFVVKDSQGVKWTVKLGNEARPETVASRLVWAAGYFANEDYFVSDLRVEGMPSHLHRGGKLVSMEGARNARLKRHVPGEEKIGTWSWKDDPFSGSREWNGLRVLMAVINNWDLKDVNNAMVREKSGEEFYLVSDLGASFGSPAHTFPHSRSKDDLRNFEKSKFVVRETPEFVSFATPGRPSIMYFGRPISFFQRRQLEWIGKNVPRKDARWMGEVLSGLSKSQVRDAFRAAGYSDSEVDQFSSVVMARIAELRAL
jgi:hypothetical protein